MIHFREGLVGRRPVTVERQVLWGDCDPAGFVYTPRFGDYAAGAAQYLSSEVIGELRDPATDRRLGLPMKALSTVFRSFLRPDDRFRMVVTVSSIGNTTFEMIIAAARLSGEPVFETRMTRICLDPVAVAAVRLPEAVRARLEDYQRECGE
ncbi:hypothetical protein KOAAANKH_00786 [Brevundimonas sp. NIBR10]|uniref:acyl-CoA thioesterase n=1 Tax=Brevundimonas sp. NIBR10 TaxID=3015997 RepID=UPI0022F16985|nr:acyl-CoA thioesterase [Brevundimonas sp. NIBR10]WGM45921.1 hypothetical protein KOAAANKH_00786 [Brevundimonas sp. NIBR10]